MNIYWPVYKNLERQFSSLMFDIHIDDDQLDVYSLKISDLILRAAVEIESIAKELYQLHGGSKVSNIKYDEDAIKYLNQQWKLEVKTVLINSTDCFLTNRTLKPFLKNEARTSSKRMTYGWNNSYQNIKHDRANSLKQANIRYLFDIMAALFLLNTYFKDETFDLGRDSKGASFPDNLGSEIFSASVHKWFMYDESGVYGKKENFEECIYLTRMSLDSREKIDKANQEADLAFKNLLINHPKFRKYTSENKLEDYKGHNLAFDVLGTSDYVTLLKQSGRTNIETFGNAQYEAILNKGDF